MRVKFLVIGFLFLLANAGEIVAQENESIPTIDPDKVRLELAIDPTAILIDVRMKIEYRKKHIEDAINLPKKKNLEAFAKKTDRYLPLYVYCTTGTRAKQAARQLRDYGFTNVYIVEGGISKWVSYNLPVEKGRK